MKTIRLKNYTSLSQEQQEEILSIRNQEQIREFSFHSEQIEKQEHFSWIIALKKDRQRLFYAVFFENEIVGGVNISDIHSSATWGVFFRNDADLLVKTLTPLYFFEYVFGVLQRETIYSEILSKNKNAISFNKNFGFKEIATTNDIIKLELSYENFEKKKKSILLRPLVKKMKQFNFIIEA